MREAAKWIEIAVVGKGARGRRLMMFPSHGPEIGSSRLRVYEVARALRTRGWVVLIVPHQLAYVQRQRLMAGFRPDYVFLQKTRYKLNRADLFKGRKIIFDLDDADYLDENHREDIADVCKNAVLTIAGSELIAAWCAQYCENVQVIWTRSPATKGKPPASQKDRAPIVTWAQRAPAGSVGEAAFVLDVMRRVRKRGVNFVFRLYGVDQSEAIQAYIAEFEKSGIQVETVGLLPYEKFLVSLRDVAVGLQPIDPRSAFSGGKSFGKVLAYLDAGVAIVASNSLEHPQFFDHGRNGILADGVEEWVVAIAELLDDAQRRASVAEAGRNDFLERLTMGVSAKEIDAAIDKLENANPV